jgi:UDP-N-acetylglucosamine--N-acetylmuramyl-(pentapeptide) pyrophosphoryl-undecaprenol N-acetylglucosamine transferase
VGAEAVMQNIVVFAGGTGGHVYPALAVATELRERGYGIHWLGTERGLEARVVPEAGYPLHTLQVSGIRGKGAVARMRGLLAIFGALLEALRRIRKLRPVCALGMGGYVAGPAGLAAWLLRVPLIIHEQNSVAGTTNRTQRRFARSILTAYPGAFGEGVDVRQVGNPVRAELLQQGRESDYGYRGDRALRLLVVGGSLGARAINEVIPEALAHLPGNCRVQLRHQTGPAHCDTVRASYGEERASEVEVLPYIEDMAAAYRWADLVICRAGALTVAELTIMGRPSVLIPLPHAIDNHQAHNASWLADQGGALLLPQSEMTATGLAGLIAELAASADRLAIMASAARAASTPAATKSVADICEEAGREY